jgi:hypothetical protein
MTKKESIRRIIRNGKCGHIMCRTCYFLRNKPKGTSLCGPLRKSIRDPKRSSYDIVLRIYRLQKLKDLQDL